MNTRIKEVVEKQYAKKGADIKKINVGSTLRVNTKIKEGNKERIQAFEGVVISKKGRGLDAMFTVRKIGAGGIGVERTFPINSPVIESIKVIKEGKAKRAKLFYIRESFGRKARKEVMKFDASGSNSEDSASQSVSEKKAE